MECIQIFAQTLNPRQHFCRFLSNFCDELQKDASVVYYSAVDGDPRSLILVAI